MLFLSVYRFLFHSVLGWVTDLGPGRGCGDLLHYRRLSSCREDDVNGQCSLIADSIQRELMTFKLILCEIRQCLMMMCYKK